MSITANTGNGNDGSASLISQIHPTIKLDLVAVVVDMVILPPMLDLVDLVVEVMDLVMVQQQLHLPGWRDSLVELVKETLDHLLLIEQVVAVVPVV